MQEVAAKTIVTRTKGSGWFGTNYNMNIYRGCCHGCIYCDSRSDSYRIDGFDEVRVKQDALRIIRDDLRRKVKPGVVGTGSMSDPYNPHEKEMELTRHALELLDAYGFGVAIATKGTLVTRDIDVLQGIREHSPVLVKVTVTTADDDLCAKIEPRAPAASRRLAAVRALSEAGIFTGVLLMPVLPYLTDSDENVLGVVRAAAAAGARFVYPAFGVTMRDTQRAHMLAELDRIFPDTSKKYVRQFGDRYSCGSPRARQLKEVFEAECKRLGLLYKMPDINAGYKIGYTDAQLSFFDQ